MVYLPAIIKNQLLSVSLDEEVLKQDGERLFTRSSSDRTRKNRFKLKEGRLRLDIWKKFFTVARLRH